MRPSAIVTLMCLGTHVTLRNVAVSAITLTLCACSASAPDLTSLDDVDSGEPGASTFDASPPPAPSSTAAANVPQGPRISDGTSALIVGNAGPNHPNQYGSQPASVNFAPVGFDWNVTTSAPVHAAPATYGVNWTSSSTADVLAFAVDATGTGRGITASSQIHAGWASAARDAGIFIFTNLYGGTGWTPDLLTYALDNVTTASFTSGGLIFDLDGTKLYALSHQGNLYCFNVPTGGAVTAAATRATACTGWTVYAANQTVTYSSPWPMYSSSKIDGFYFGDDAGNLHCVTSTGTSCWSGGAGPIVQPGSAQTVQPLASPIVLTDASNFPVVYVGDAVGRFIRVIDKGTTPAPGSVGSGVASVDLCGAAPGSCGSNWAIRSSATIDVTTDTAYVASGGSVFEFPVDDAQNWQPRKTAKALVTTTSSDAPMTSTPTLDRTNGFLYVGYNNTIYKLVYPFDGSATNGIYSTALQASGPDKSYPRGTPLSFNSTVYIGTGKKSSGTGLVESYGCGGSTSFTPPVLTDVTAANYGYFVGTPMIVDYLNGNVNFGYDNGTTGGIVQFPPLSSTTGWACPSGDTSVSGLACGSSAACISKCASASACNGAHESAHGCGTSTGLCTATCAAGYADCDQNLNTDGCETHTASDTDNCGGCGTTCSTNHITPTCTSSACGGTCDVGYANCNANAADGCETATTCSAKGCCGATCSSGQACVNGTCGSSTVTECSTVSEHATAQITCPGGTVVKSITFASFGTPTGTCGSFATSSCNATTSSAVVSAACLGKASCSVSAEDSVFVDPCTNTFKRLYIQAACACP